MQTGDGETRGTMQTAHCRLFTELVLLFPSLRGNCKQTIQSVVKVKVVANEDTLLRTHCGRRKCFPVCPCAQHLLQTQILCPGHKNVSDFVQKHLVSAKNVSQFARVRKHHEQQCVRNNVSSFASTFKLSGRFHTRGQTNRLAFDCLM